MNYIRAIGISCTLLFSANLFAGGGLQLIFNKSNKTVVIALGDWFPTPYTIGPGQSSVVYVSTDQQAITIQSVR